MPDKIIRTPFGILLQDIRQSLKENQKEFSARFHVSRTLIAALETKVRPSKEFVDALIAEFPDREGAILTACNDTGQSQSSSRKRSTRSRTQRRIEAQIELGHFPEAAQAICDQLLHTKPDEHKRYWLYYNFGKVAAILGDMRTSFLALRMAVSVGEELRLDETELVTVWALLIDSLLAQNPRLAQYYLDDALRLHPTAAAIWCRKSLMHLFDQEYSNAYAALTVAVHHERSRPDIRLIRGQVLSEWGRCHEAVNELREVMKDPEIDPTSRVLAWAAIGHALAQLDDHEGALQAFSEADKLAPGSSTLYYRGICYAKMGKKKAAIDAFERLLEHTGSNPLPLLMMQDVEHRLSSLKENKQYVSLARRERDNLEAELASENQTWDNISRNAT